MNYSHCYPLAITISFLIITIFSSLFALVSSWLFQSIFHTSGRWTCLSVQVRKCQKPPGDFPSGPVVRNLSCDAGIWFWGTGWRTKITHVLGQLSLSAATTEPTSTLWRELRLDLGVDSHPGSASSGMGGLPMFPPQHLSPHQKMRAVKRVGPEKFKTSLRRCLAQRKFSVNSNYYFSCP